MGDFFGFLLPYYLLLLTFLNVLFIPLFFTFGQTWRLGGFDDLWGKNIGCHKATGHWRP